MGRITRKTFKGALRARPQSTVSPSLERGSGPYNHKSELAEAGDRLRQTMKRLPVPRDRREAIDDEVATLLYTVFRSEVRDVLRVTEAEVAPAKRWLERLAKLSNKLRLHLIEAPRVAPKLEKLEIHGAWWDTLPSWFSLRELDEVLAKAAEAASRAQQELAELRVQHRPINTQAKIVTRIAARCYERLTGKAPTVSVREIEVATGVVKARRCGRFVQFLAEVFAALEIDANARYEAATFLKHKSSRKKTA